MATSEDFEFEDCDEDDWGELEEIDQGKDNIRKLKERMQDNECWKCSSCEAINNIKITMDTDDMKCIKCKQDK